MASNRSEEYKFLSSKVKAATNEETLRRLDRSATNVYNAGFLTVGEFRQLDDMICTRLAKLEG